MSDEAKTGLQLSSDKGCSSFHSGAALRRGHADQGNPPGTDRHDRWQGRAEVEGMEGGGQVSLSSRAEATKVRFPPKAGFPTICGPGVHRLALSGGNVPSAKASFNR